MLNNNLENRGILGYSNSKEKKRMDTILDSAKIGNATPVEFFEPSQDLSQVGATVDRIGRLDNMLADTNQRSDYYRRAAREEIVPTDTPERRRRNFVLSSNVVDEAMDDYYKSNVKPELEKQRMNAEAEASDIYRSNAAVPGSEPFAAMGAARKATDPAMVMGRTMEKIDGAELDSIAGAYARYGGLDADAYRESVLKPSLQQRMHDDYVKSYVPKSSAEYMARNAWDGSLSGKLTNMALDGFSQSNSHTLMSEEGKQQYNANRVENFASGVGSLLIDSGIFSGLGALSSGITGKATSAIANNLASRVYSKGLSKGISGATAKNIVDRVFLNNIGTRIAQSGSAQGLTLGTYDATNSVVDDLLYGEGVDAGKAAGAFGKGFGTGMMLGAVGTPLRSASRGLTGGKKIAASAGVLSAESAVFTLGTEVDKMANDIEVEPIDLLSDFGESAATLLAMRMAHWMPRGVREKLGADGRLKKGLTFTASERGEMRNAGVDADGFISTAEHALRSGYEGLRGNLRNDFIRSYEQLMSNDMLSASTRAKLLYIVENKLTSTPPVAVDCSVAERGDGFVVDVKDNVGRRVERRTFDSRTDAEAFVERNSGFLRSNRIATIEDAFRRSIDSRNFFRQAGAYARETGADVNEISAAMYKRAQGKGLNAREAAMIDEIMSRASYTDAEHGNVMHDIRRNVELRNGLEKGALITAVDKKTSECSDAELRALDEYEALIKEQNELMRSGVSSDMHADAQQLMAKHGFEGYGNEQIKEYERQYNSSLRARPQHGDADMIPSYKIFHPKEYAQAKQYGFPYPEDGAPMLKRGDARNPSPTNLFSHDQLARMAVKVRDIADKLHTDVELIYDPHQFNPNEELLGYKMAAKGWHDAGNDKVTINLAANESVEDAGFTALHEIVGHKSFDNLFGREYANFLYEMLSRATPEVVKKVNMYKKRGYDNELQAMDEYLADLAQSLDNTPTERRLLQRTIDFLGDALNRLRIPYVRDLSEGKIRMLLQQHRRALENRVSADKRRRDIFGSFKASHKDEDAYESEFYGKSNDEAPVRGRTSPLAQNRFRFLGTKGVGNLEKAGILKSGLSNLRIAKMLTEEGVENQVGNYKDDVASDWNFAGDGVWYKRGEAAKEPVEDIKISPDKVKTLTGWEVGADGQWRYEIDDSDINVQYCPLVQLRRERPRLYNFYMDVTKGFIDGKELENSKHRRKLDELSKFFQRHSDKDVKLSDAVPDKYFYEAYPEYKDVKVKYIAETNTMCAYDPAQKVFYINQEAIGTTELNKSVAAEMQRMIQRSEGFSTFIPAEEYVPADVLQRLRKPIDTYIEYRNKYSGDPNVWPKLENDLRQYFLSNYGIDVREIPVGNKREMERFLLSLLKEKPTMMSGDIEEENVKKRFYLPEFFRRRILAEDTELLPRSFQVTPMNVSDMRNHIRGPLDIIRSFGMWPRRQNPIEKSHDGDLLN